MYLKAWCDWTVPSAPSVIYPHEPLPQKVWVVSARQTWTLPKVPFLDVIATMQARWGLDVVAPLTILHSSDYLSPTYDALLRSGHALSTKTIVEWTVDCIKKKQFSPSTRDCGAGWLLHGVPVDNTSLELLHTHSVLPELLCILDTPPLDNLSAQETKAQQAYRDGLLRLKTAAAALNITTHTFDVHPLADSDDTLAMIQRRLNPLERNRIDDEDQGIMMGAPAISSIEEESRKCWGHCHTFCPVSFADTSSLFRAVPGNVAYSSFLGQRRYAMAGPVEQSAFDRNPLRFVPTSPQTTFRPVVLLLGISGSGRRSIVRDIDISNGIL